MNKIKLILLLPIMGFIVILVGMLLPQIFGLKYIYIEDLELVNMYQEITLFDFWANLIPLFAPVIPFNVMPVAMIILMMSIIQTFIILM